MRSKMRVGVSRGGALLVLIKRNAELRVVSDSGGQTPCFFLLSRLTERGLRFQRERLAVFMSASKFYLTFFKGGGGRSEPGCGEPSEGTGRLLRRFTEVIGAVVSTAQPLRASSSCFHGRERGRGEGGHIWFYLCQSFHCVNENINLGCSKVIC